MPQGMKILIVGYGSIGSRHLHNLEIVLGKRGIGFTADLVRSGIGRPVDDASQKLVSREFSYDDNIPDDYDIAFITNPTFRHFDTIRAFTTKAKHMFIEKPVFHRSDMPLEKLGLKNGSIYYVACPLRYTNVIRYLKDNIEPEAVRCARAICSSYLPEWRSGTDYRNTYSAHRDQGGGVSIDLIHEWDYITSMFGMPDRVYNVRGKFSDLEIDSDDLSVYIARYPDKAVELHLDYFGRRTVREIQLFTDEDTITGDLVSNEIRYSKKGETVNLNEFRNDFQLRELEHFFDIIDGTIPNDNDIPTAVKILELAEGVNDIT